MPHVASVTDVTNITTTYAGTNDFLLWVKSASTDVITGLFEFDGTGYSDYAELSSAEGVKLEFELVVNPIDLVAGETISVVTDDGTFVVYISVVPVDGTIWYLDSNGVPFSNAALTTPISGEIATPEDVSIDEPTGGDASEGETQDVVILTETNETDLELFSNERSRVTEAVDDIVNSSEEVEETLFIIDTTAVAFQNNTESLRIFDILDEDEAEVSTEEDISIGDAPDTDLGYESFESPVSIQDTSKSSELSPLFLMVTEPFDMNIRGQKFVESVEIGSADTGDLEAALDFRFAKDESWTRSGFVDVNDEGIAWIRAAGIEFRLVLQSTVKVENKPDYIIAHWKAIDKRGVRGPYVQSN